jgi:transposase/transposase-like protein
MSKQYHSNAKTNTHIRELIQNSNEPARVLAERFDINMSTVYKWRNSNELEDKSCRPHKTRDVLSETEQWICCEVRQTSGFSLDELVPILKPFIPKINRYNLYRVLKNNGLNKLPKENAPKDKKKHSQFADYPIGYVHIDVKYMPKLVNEEKRKYLFVAIERNTRYVYIALKDNKNKQCACEFLNECIKFFPFKIATILTDNGKEFTDRYARNQKIPTGKHAFDILCKINGIEHRLTKAFSPQTNGMVERYNRRVEEILEQKKFIDYIALMKTLKKHLECYNYYIKQRVLGDRSPYQIMLEWYYRSPDSFNIFPEAIYDNLSQPYK